MGERTLVLNESEARVAVRGINNEITRLESFGFKADSLLKELKEIRTKLFDFLGYDENGNHKEKK